MLFRSIRALGALLLIVLGSGCCHDHWCLRPACALRCQPACCPESNCCNVTGYLPPQTMAPPILH